MKRSFGSVHQQPRSCKWHAKMPLGCLGCSNLMLEMRIWNRWCQNGFQDECSTSQGSPLFLKLNNSATGWGGGVDGGWGWGASGNGGREWHRVVRMTFVNSHSLYNLHNISVHTEKAENVQRTGGTMVVERAFNLQQFWVDSIYRQCLTSAGNSIIKVRWS